MRILAGCYRALNGCTIIPRYIHVCQQKQHCGALKVIRHASSSYRYFLSTAVDTKEKHLKISELRLCLLEIEMSRTWLTHSLGRVKHLILSQFQNFNNREIFLKSTLFLMRKYSIGHDSSDKESPPPPKEKMVNLMDFPPVIWPNLLQTMKNWFITKIIMQTYFDKDFTLTEFSKGARQAFTFVSYQLSNGSFDKLEGLVTTEALNEIKSNYPRLSLKQRQQLATTDNDIYLAFPYQIGIILDEDRKKRFAEILVVFHCVSDIEGVIGDHPNLSDMRKYTDKIFVCNYRFIREYTKGVQSDWTINRLNHFCAADLSPYGR